MNENNSHNGSLENSANDELLARVAAADPSAGFDASTLSATLVDDAVARAAEAPSKGFANRLTARLSDAYRERPRFVLGSSLGAVASVAALAVAGTMAFGSLGSNQRTLFTVASLQSGQPVMSDSKVSESSIHAGNGMMVPYFFNHYSAAASLSNDSGSEHIYALQPVANPSNFLQKLADHFGISSPVHRGTYTDFTTNPDETAPFDPESTRADLSLNLQGGGNWWLTVNQPAPMLCAIDSASTEPKSCAAPPLTEPVTVPSAAKAKTQFIEVMKLTGFDFASGDITLQRDPYSTYASAQISLPLAVTNKTTNLMFSMSWNDKGEVTSASGIASKIVDQGSFDLISPVAAVARANDIKWANYLGFGGGPIAYDSVKPGAPAVRTGSLVGDTATPPAGSSSSSGGSATAPTAVPMPVETALPSDAPDAVDPTSTTISVDPTPAPIETGVAPTPELQEVVIDRVELGWMQLTDSNGHVWLVPGYLLFAGEVSYQIVPAIADGLMGF